VRQAASSFGMYVEEIDDKVIDDIKSSTSSKYGMRAYKSLIESKCSEIFADYMESEDINNVIISGTLDAIQIIPSSKPVPPSDLQGECEIIF